MHRSWRAAMARVLPGRVVYVDDKEVWRAIGRDMLSSNDGGETWALRGRLPTVQWRQYLSGNRYLRRLLRLGVHHFIKTGNNVGLVFADRGIFRLCDGVPAFEWVSSLGNSRRPLAVAKKENTIFFGEYRDNSERSPIRIWALDICGSHQQVAWEFDSVRHVHGVFSDPFTGSVWVTTGDDDQEAAIWRTDDEFRSLEKVVGGSQRYRAVHLLFTEDAVFFGSDAPNEKNRIYRMDRASHQILTMGDVSGSVFYGVKVNDWLFFSTAVEPSRVNRGRYVELWGARSGGPWTLIGRLKKDRLSMKHFQYGQILFPGGPGDDRQLWFTPFATAQDQRTIRVSLADLRADGGVFRS